MMLVLTIFYILSSGHLAVLAYNNGLARTPPMGWNSWNHFGGRVSADLLRQTADAFVSLGLKDAGYTFINTVRASRSHLFCLPHAWPLKPIYQMGHRSAYDPG